MDKEGLHPATGQGQAHPGYILALERGSGKQNRDRRSTPTVSVDVGDTHCYYF